MFAEFFPEAGQPLTEAMALHQVAVLPAFGLNVNDADDFWSPAGKEKIERMEGDPLVAAKFRTPPFATFGMSRREQVQLLNPQLMSSSCSCGLGFQLPCRCNSSSIRLLNCKTKCAWLCRWSVPSIYLGKTCSRAAMVPP